MCLEGGGQAGSLGLPELQEIQTGREEEAEGGRGEGRRRGVVLSPKQGSPQNRMLKMTKTGKGQRKGGAGEYPWGTRKDAEDDINRKGTEKKGGRWNTLGRYQGKKRVASCLALCRGGGGGVLFIISFNLTKLTTRKVLSPPGY